VSEKKINPKDPSKTVKAEAGTEDNEESRSTQRVSSRVVSRKVSRIAP